jgi:sec-independent protein translocase protein TatA
MNLSMLPPLASILSPLDILVIVVLALLFFGPGKLAGLGKGLGEGIKNFKTAVNDDKKPDSNAPDEKK